MIKVRGIATENTYIILNGAESFSVGNKGVGIHFKGSNHPVYIWPTNQIKKPYVDIHGSYVVETKMSPMAIIKKLDK